MPLTVAWTCSEEEAPKLEIIKESLIFYHHFYGLCNFLTRVEATTTTSPVLLMRCTCHSEFPNVFLRPGWTVLTKNVGQTCSWSSHCPDVSSGPYLLNLGNFTCNSTNQWQGTNEITLEDCICVWSVGKTGQPEKRSKVTATPTSHEDVNWLIVFNLLSAAMP